MKRFIAFLIFIASMITLAYSHHVGPFAPRVIPEELLPLRMEPETQVSGEDIIDVIIDDEMVLIPVYFPSIDEEYYFLFDTGAMSVIDKELALKLGLVPEFHSLIEGSDGNSSVAYNSTLDELQVGNIKVENFEATVFDVSEIDENSDYTVSGILGSDILRYFVVTLDYDNALVDMTTSRSSIDPDRAGYIIPFEMNPEMGYIPVVSCMIDDNILIDGIIDTGFNGFAVIPLGYLQDEMSEDDEEIISAIGSMGGGATADAGLMYMLRLPKFSLGNFTITKVPVVTRNIDQMLIGYEFLSHFVMTLDYLEGFCYLYPNELEFISNYVSFGFGLEQEDSLFYISGFWENSSAYRSELEIGDIVLEINSMPIQLIEAKNLDESDFKGDTNSIVLLVSNQHGLKTVELHNEPLFAD